MDFETDFDPDGKIYLSWCKAVLVRELDQHKCTQITNGAEGYERWQGPSRWFNLIFDQEEGWLKLQAVNRGEFTVYVQKAPAPIFQYDNYSQRVNFLHTSFETWLEALFSQIL